MNRHRAFGRLSHITPVLVPLLVVWFYAPLIAIALQTHGWNRGSALLVGGVICLSYIFVALVLTVVVRVPPRFGKLAAALEVLVWLVPLGGMFALVLWGLLRFLLQIAR